MCRRCRGASGTSRYAFAPVCKCLSQIKRSSRYLLMETISQSPTTTYRHVLKRKHNHECRAICKQSHWLLNEAQGIGYHTTQLRSSAGHAHGKGLASTSLQAAAYLAMAGPHPGAGKVVTQWECTVPTKPSAHAC